MDGIGGRPEDGEEAVAFPPTLDQQPLVRADEFGGQGIVTSQGGAHGFRGSLPEPGAALDIGKQEGDRPGRRGPWRDLPKKLARPHYSPPPPGILPGAREAGIILT